MKEEILYDVRFFPATERDKGPRLKMTKFYGGIMKGSNPMSYYGE